jgi:hypothetical protein
VIFCIVAAGVPSGNASVSTNFGVEFLVRLSDADAPRADCIFQIVFGVNRTRVNVSAPLSAALALNIGFDDTAASNRVWVVTKFGDVHYWNSRKSIAAPMA